MNLVAAIVGAPGPAQRRAIAKAITLLESTRPDHRLRADEVLTTLLPQSGRAFRLGISGVPGFRLLPGLLVSGDISWRVTNYYIAWGVLLFAMLMLFMGGRILAPAIAGTVRRRTGSGTGCAREVPVSSVKVVDMESSAKVEGDRDRLRP